MERVVGGPTTEEYAKVGWPRTDGLVSDAIDIISTTAAYEQGLFSSQSDYCTVLLAVSSLPYKDKNTGLPAAADYGIYWTPNNSEKPFRVYHCSKTTRWMTEHSSEALPRFVRMGKTKIKGKDAFDPTFYPMKREEVEFMWENVIPPAWQIVIENEAKEFP